MTGPASQVYHLQMDTQIALPDPDLLLAKIGDTCPVRYIKLGSGAVWAEQAFEESILPVDFRDVPHELCAAGDWVAVNAHLRAAGNAARTATNWTRELREFYELDERCLWFTISNGHLYWAFAAPEVISTPNDRNLPQRHRRIIGEWSRSDLLGKPLTTRSLSSALLRTASYQMTICSAERQSYLLRRIRGDEDPLHVEAKLLQAKMVELAVAMICQLDWRDFEMLVDLIFARGGWQRGSAIGKGEVDVDLSLTMPTTGELAWVQIKSKASQAILNDYLGRFERDGSCQHFFFVCHTAVGSLIAPEGAGLHVWTGPTLARATIAAGLFDWLAERTR